MRRRDLLVGGGALALATGAAWLAKGQPEALTQAAFDEWVAGLRQRAGDAGVQPDTWDMALQGLAPDPVVIARRAAAAETNQTVTDYVMRLLNGHGVKARAKFASLPALAQIEQRYGVPGGPLVAFWGMESDYGSNIGDRDVLRAIATHGASGSSGPDWGEEFVAALKILQSGVVQRPGMIGSYAGALGQTQLMPTNYIRYGADFDGDGRIDVWSDPLDALASTAVVLVKLAGWRSGESWLEEVDLPAGFDLTKVETEVTALTPAEWEAMGARRASGRPWSSADQASSASLLLPAGITAPAFLAFPNYAAFETYNPSLSYAVGVCLLAKFAMGEPAVRKPWPPEPLLPRESRIAAQAGLARLGYYDGKLDGDWGRRSRRALRAWQLATGHPRDGHLTAEQAHALAA
jgi:membrane-bound lytic murein transglycosylase B